MSLYQAPDHRVSIPTTVSVQPAMNIVLLATQTSSGIHLSYYLVQRSIVLPTCIGGACLLVHVAKRRHCIKILQALLGLTLGSAGRRRWARACRC